MDKLELMREINSFVELELNYVNIKVEKEFGLRIEIYEKNSTIIKEVNKSQINIAKMNTINIQQKVGEVYIYEMTEDIDKALQEEFPDDYEKIIRLFYIVESFNN